MLKNDRIVATASSVPLHKQLLRHWKTSWPAEVKTLWSIIFWSDIHCTRPSSLDWISEFNPGAFRQQSIQVSIHYSLILGFQLSSNGAETELTLSSTSRPVKLKKCWTLCWSRTSATKSSLKIFSRNSTKKTLQSPAVWRMPWKVSTCSSIGADKIQDLDLFKSQSF